MTRTSNKKGAAHAAPKYVVDMMSPVRHLVTALAAQAGGLVSISGIAGSYRHHAGDLTRLKEHEGCKDDEVAKEWLIREAAEALKRYVEITEQDGETLVALRGGITADNVRYERKKVTLNVDDHAVFGDPFNPHSGELVDMRKNTGKDNLEGLIDSLETFGWVPELPAYRDERGVILTGNRRLKAAERLGITPHIEDLLPLGRGDDADAKRMALAVAANLGHKPLTKEERAKVVEFMTKYKGWSQAKVAKALNVSQRTVSDDLNGISKSANSEEKEEGMLVGSEGAIPYTKDKGRGAPRKPRKAPVKATKFESVRGRIAELLEQGDMTQQQIANEVGGSVQLVKKTIAWMEGKAAEPMRQPEAPTTASMCTCPQCGHVHSTKNPAEV